MAVTYTTAAIVKNRVKQISASLLDANIEENILQAEGVIDAAMKKTARGSSPDFTFDADKHGIIRDCATNYAAYSSLLYDVSEFTSSNFARAVLEELRKSTESSLVTLAHAKIQDYLEGL